ncbi:MAG TPA: type II toxin-antitoxin system Phd/YefM family antitoxin [Chloroflexota bacterium]|nr:type II toxin-antitoxin system Phd/YefM family antitoxin [Chloroflexota bacterium]
MSEERVPIGEFRAKTAEILRAVRETKATYVITNHGEPVAEVVPYGTPIRKKGKPILGIFDDGTWVNPWEEEGISKEEWQERDRARKIAYQEWRAEKIHRRSLGLPDQEQPMPEYE